MACRSCEKCRRQDAQRFIERLNRTHEATFRLPTEAEWEYAARAGTSTRFYWGTDEEAASIQDHAWAHSYAEGTSHPVGQKQPNPWGLYDMSGNVWEWTQDWYGSYADTAQVDPTGPAQGERKVYRGGRLVQRALHPSLSEPAQVPNGRTVHQRRGAACARGRARRFDGRPGLIPRRLPRPDSVRNPM